MRTQLNLLLAFGAMSCFSALPQNSVPSKAELKTIILRSRHLGAHGMGYNDDSLTKLSRTITPDDIPNLISLLGDRELRVGAQFALASQCEASIKPVHDATIHSEAIASLDAGDIMTLIAGFNQCSPHTQAQARVTRLEIDLVRKRQLAQKTQELQDKTKDDARIERNALKMNDPQQRKMLTREEREEVFKRSVKAAGLENPQTPAQKALVDRMYRTMVLDEPSPPKSQ